MTTEPRWRDAASESFWLDDLRRPEAHSEFLGTSACDIAVIGGGFTGLWSALLAKQRRPNARVILVEAARIAEHASGRNGGFCAASLTHGDANGRSRWPEEMPTLRALGAQNLQEILDAIISRDLRDENREISPLIPAQDAMILDTSDMHMNNVIEVMHQEIQRRGMQ